MKFILTIDTEGDNQWDQGRKLTVENIKYIPKFQDLCNKYSIKPTYLVTSEICDDSFAKEIFKEYLLTDKAEIGAHLHSWTTPPFEDEDGYRFNDQNHAFASELSDELISKKIKNLTDQIEISFGKRPFSFRSGRYGFNKNVAKILIENYYLVDSSVTPYVSWTNTKGLPGGNAGPDFIDKSPFPYRYNFGKDSLLELPITILPTKFPLNKNKFLAKYYFRNVNNNILLKVCRRLLYNNQPLWLRPHPLMNIILLEELLNESINLRLPYIVMMFHSSELMPGCSIYRKNNDAIDELYDLLENFFVILSEKNISSFTLTEATRNYNM